MTVPFGRLALCLDCEATWALGPDTCAACGSAHFVLVVRWLDRAAAAETAA